MDIELIRVLDVNTKTNEKKGFGKMYFLRTVGRIKGPSARPL
jgi:hypothetical protein